MPSRIIREGILTSPKVNQLTSGAELFYRRLLSVVDDYGRYHAHPTLVRAATFPTKMDVVEDAHVTKWLNETIKVGLVNIYERDGHKYLEVINFGQKVRAKSKFPAPCQQPASTLPAECPQPAGEMSSVVVVEGVVEGVSKALTDSDESAAPTEPTEPTKAQARFNNFWQFYPRKIGKGKAWAVFKRLSADDQTAAIEQSEAYSQAYALAPPERRQFFKHPATWLNSRSWEDDHAEWKLLIESK